MLQLSPTIPLIITSKDNREAVAWFVKDYSTEHDTLFGVFMRDDNTFWWVPSYEVRSFTNWSMGRPINEHPKKDQQPVEAEEQPSFSLRDYGIGTGNNWERTVREKYIPPGDSTCHRPIDIPGIITSPLKTR